MFAAEVLGANVVGAGIVIITAHDRDTDAGAGLARIVLCTRVSVVAGAGCRWVVTSEAIDAHVLGADVLIVAVQGAGVSTALV
jgi:hypothetical protein